MSPQGDWRKYPKIAISSLFFIPCKISLSKVYTLLYILKYSCYNGFVESLLSFLLNILKY